AMAGEDSGEAGAGDGIEGVVGEEEVVMGGAGEGMDEEDTDTEVMEDTEGKGDTEDTEDSTDRHQETSTALQTHPIQTDRPTFRDTAAIRVVGGCLLRWARIVGNIAR
ncbi:hypothetical protein FRC11_010042, partial [Ceratobasidium sp. 423]